MDATQDLVNEHKAVLVALRLLEKIEGALAARDRQAPEHLDQLLGFFRGFVDRCHHAKEEEVLFPEMERLGLEGEGPIGTMLEEHEAGRRCVRGMAEGLARFQQGDPRRAPRYPTERGRLSGPAAPAHREGGTSPLPDGGADGASEAGRRPDLPVRRDRA